MTVDEIKGRAWRIVISAKATQRAWGDDFSEEMRAHATRVFAAIKASRVDPTWPNVCDAARAAHARIATCNRWEVMFVRATQAATEALQAAWEAEHALCDRDKYLREAEAALARNW